MKSLLPIVCLAVSAGLTLAA
jgi:hypothetical protein